MQTLGAPRNLTASALSGRGVLSLVADAVICTDDEGRILLANRGSEQIFGYRESELIGRSVDILIPDRLRDQHAEHVRRFANASGDASRLMGRRREVCGRRKGGEDFPAEATVSRQAVDGSVILTVVVRDITERKALEAEREAIAREADHRIKNLFSVVNSLVALTARTASDITAFKESLLDRLSALARTQKALWSGTGQTAILKELLTDELTQYRSVDGSNVLICGPKVVVDAKVAQTFALAFHELATNSAKYGALKTASGRVTVIFAFTDDDKLAIEWIERGGPPISPPTREGFGTLLIKQIIQRTFGADVSLEYPSQGFVCRMQLPRTKVETPSVAH